MAEMRTDDDEWEESGRSGEYSLITLIDRSRRAGFRDVETYLASLPPDRARIWRKAMTASEEVLSPEARTRTPAPRQRDVHRWGHIGEPAPRVRTRRAKRVRRLGELREDRDMPQIDLAARLKVSGPVLSRLEHQTSMGTKTLRRFVEGLGGRLEIRAVFADQKYLITFEAPKEARERPTRHIVLLPRRRTRKSKGSPQ